jgi:hypothetical protein
MCAYGKAARTAIGDQEMSIEAAVIGIVDQMNITGAESDEIVSVARELNGEKGT